MNFKPLTMPRKATGTLSIKGWGGGLNTREADLDVEDDELTGGTNVLIDTTGAIGTKPGRTLYGNFVGTTTKTLGLFNFVNLTGTQERLMVYDTSIYRDVAGVWTALTGATQTTNKQTEGAYYESTNKFYLVNKTDDAVVYTSGTSVATDANFKKGQYIVAFKNRLLTANVSSQEDYVWYTDLGLDTFSANNYFRVPGGAITGMIVSPSIQAVLIFTKRGIYRLQNFTFDGVAAGPEAVITVSQTTGAISGRSIVEVNGLVYFLGQDTKDIAQIYVTDGHSVQAIGDKVRTELSALLTSQLPNAAAVPDGRFYRLSVTRGTVNDTELLYDTVRKRWLTRWSGGYSCYTISETTSAQQVYGGDPTYGMTFKLTSTATSDEGFDQTYLAGQDADTTVNANAATRAAQAFKISTDSGTTQKISGVVLRLKKNAGTTTGLTVRIETDSSNVPSGTLASANLTTTLAAITSTSYIWSTATFSTPAAVNGNTTYWIVVQHTTEGTGDSQYHWGSDSSSPTYANGTNATYASSTWSAGTSDMIFGLITQGQIAFSAETKSYTFGDDFQEKWLSDGFFVCEPSTTLNFGINNLASVGYVDTVIDTSQSGGTTWGGGAKWGDSSTYGSTNVRQIEIFNIDPGMARGRGFKFRFSNTSTTANKIYRLSLKYRKSQSLK